jgi:predicted ATP-grasp superfamily ATP-dependent carboligase
VRQWRSVWLVLTLSLFLSEPDRPNNALDYVKKYLGAPPAVDLDGLKQENEDMKKQIEKLKKQATENRK